MDRLLLQLSSRFGLSEEFLRTSGVERVLERRRGRHALEEYLSLIGENPIELEALVNELTVGETCFFRQPEHFRVMLSLLPAEPLPVRVLSAGCSTGEEAYTLAIVLSEAFPERAIQVVAVDLNPAALRSAQLGLYRAWALRETPENIRQRWFSNTGDSYRIADSLKSKVGFYKSNLADPLDKLWQEAPFHAIFLRNVLMYLSPAASQDALERICRLLLPEAPLFLGYAETTRSFSPGRKMRQVEDAWLYQAGTAASGQWAEVIAQRSARIARLVAPAKPGPASVKGWTPGPVLVRALELAETGYAEEAEKLCRAEDPAPELRYIWALCREQLGDLEEAEQQARVALAMDPGFAMARLQLARLLRRLGQKKQAMEIYQQAIQSFATEAESRILLFGGGFGRDVLVQMAQAEATACGRA